jgi:hypothetical protein
MIRYSENEVRRLLRQPQSELEMLQATSPYDEALAYALTIKDFMKDHGIAAVEEGLARFWQFKEGQAASLAAVGLASRRTGPLPSPRLASQSI